MSEGRQLPDLILGLAFALYGGDRPNPVKMSSKRDFQHECDLTAAHAVFEAANKNGRSMDAHRKFLMNEAKVYFILTPCHLV